MLAFLRNDQYIVCKKGKLELIQQMLTVDQNRVTRRGHWHQHRIC